jgi:uncharacterized protein (TIGR02271 family)
MEQRSPAEPESRPPQHPSQEEQHQRLPLVREELSVGKREVETGKVVVDVVTEQRREKVAVPLIETQVDIERVPINRRVDSVSEPRQEGETVIVPVYEESYVVEKRLILKEEIRLTRKTSERSAEREVVLRSEEAQVRRVESAE